MHTTFWLYSFSSPSSSQFLSTQLHVLSSSQPPKTQKSKVNKQPKKTIRQSNTKQKVHKKHVLANYSLAKDLPSRVAEIPNGTRLEKTLGFGRGYQSQRASCLGVGLCVHFPFSVLGFLSGLNLCRSWVCCHNSCGFPCASALLCLDDTATISSTYDLSASSLA